MNPYSTELRHHGILGQKWGKQNGPPYPLGSDVSTGKRLKKTFVSGSSKTQDPNSEYYKKKLPYKVRRELNSKIKSGNTILVGDAPGIDRQVQDYLKKKGYKNVEVYSPGKQSRYLADKGWKNKLIDDPKHEPGSPEWLAKKDKVMTKEADDGIAVVLPNGGAKATRNNIARLQSQNKPVSIHELKMNDPDIKKKIIIGAAVAGTALSVAGGIYLYKSGKLNGLLNKSKDLTGEFGLKIKTKDASNFDKAIREDAKRINKGGLFGNLFLKNRENNCVLCSTDYDLRRRGFDTVAKTSPRGKNADEILLNYKNLDRTAYKLTKSNTDLISQLSQEGEGARGIILGSRGILNGSGGHAFNYEIRNNKVYIIDGQIGKVYDSPNQIHKYLRTQGFHEYAALRTDDKELSDRVLSMVSDSKKGLSNLKGEHLSDLGVNVAAALGITAASAASNAYIDYRDNKEYEEYVKSQADRRKTDK